MEKDFNKKVYSTVLEEIEQLRDEIQSYRFISNYIGYIITKLVDKDFVPEDDRRNKQVRIARALLVKYKVNADFNINQLKTIKNDLLRAIGY